MINLDMPFVKEFTANMTEEKKGQIVGVLNTLVVKAQQYQGILVKATTVPQFEAYDGAKDTFKNAIVSCIENGLLEKIKEGSNEEILGKIKHWGKGVESSKTADNAEMLINEFKKASVDFLAKSKAVKSVTMTDENGKDVGFYFLFRKYKKGGKPGSGKYDENVGYVKFIKECSKTYGITKEVLSKTLEVGGITSQKLFSKVEHKI